MGGKCTNLRELADLPPTIPQGNSVRAARLICIQLKKCRQYHKKCKQNTQKSKYLTLMINPKGICRHPPIHPTPNLPFRQHSESPQPHMAKSTTSSPRHTQQLPMPVNEEHPNTCITGPIPGYPNKRGIAHVAPRGPPSPRLGLSRCTCDPMEQVPKPPHTHSHKPQITTQNSAPDYGPR